MLEPAPDTQDRPVHGGAHNVEIVTPPSAPRAARNSVNTPRKFLAALRDEVLANENPVHLLNSMKRLRRRGLRVWPIRPNRVLRAMRRGPRGGLLVVRVHWNWGQGCWRFASQPWMLIPAVTDRMRRWLAHPLLWGDVAAKEEDFAVRVVRYAKPSDLGMVLPTVDFLSVVGSGHGEAVELSSQSLKLFGAVVKELTGKEMKSGLSRFLDCLAYEWAVQAGVDVEKVLGRGPPVDADFDLQAEVDRVYDVKKAWGEKRAAKRRASVTVGERR